MGNNKTKNIILAVLVVGIVSMTIAFAALTQQLNITDNVATVSSNWSVRFAPTVTTSVGTTIAGTTTGATYTSNTPTVTNDQQTITGLQATFTKPGDYVEVAFTVRNEGNIAAKGQGVTLSLGNLTCAPGSGSSVSEEAANTFCTKLVKWVKHSDRVTDWTSADTLAAYSGSGNDYPHIDGILRIEYPSTLSNSDISAISGGSIVVTLGDTTLNFEQDDNVTASNNSGNEQGGNEPVTPSNPYLTTFDGTYEYQYYNYDNDHDKNYEDIEWRNSLDDLSYVSIYNRKNTSTDIVESCIIISGGTVCFNPSLWDYTCEEEEIFDEETGDYIDTTTICSSGEYVLNKKTEFESKGAICEINEYNRLVCYEDEGPSAEFGEYGYYYLAYFNHWCSSDLQMCDFQ